MSTVTSEDVRNLGKPFVTRLMQNGVAFRGSDGQIEIAFNLPVSDDESVERIVADLQMWLANRMIAFPPDNADSGRGRDA